MTKQIFPPVAGRRAESSRSAILQRLSRIEGQVRGIRAMVEGDRPVADQIQQFHAVISALREVALMQIRCEIQAQLMPHAGEAETKAPDQAAELTGLIESSFRLR
jgi:CsoR family transcriptional regulator, copper-sensing transcriptional repressor